MMTPAQPAGAPMPTAKLDLATTLADIERAAAVAETPVDLNLSRAVLQAYWESFSQRAVSFRTSTKPREKRTLNVRYVDLEQLTDPWPVALEAGLLKPAGHAIESLYAEVAAQYPVVGYGVDFGVAHGIEKIWQFFSIDPQPIDRIAGLSSFPPAARTSFPLFRRYGLEACSLFGFDFRNRSINVYFMRPPGFFSPEQLAGMIADAGFAVPSPEMLQYSSMAVPIYFTFTWDSPQVERLCFGVAAFDDAQVPRHLDPLIERYVAGAPFVTPARTFIFNVTLARSGDFIKIENDYSGLMIEEMKRFVVMEPPAGSQRDGSAAIARPTSSQAGA